MSWSVRARLTAWSVVVTTVFLAGFGAVTYALLARMLQRRMDESLVATLQSFRHSVQTEVAARGAVHDLDAVLREEAAELPFPDRAITVFRADGSLVTETRHLPVSALRSTRVATLATLRELRAYAAPFVVARKRFVVVIARPLEEQAGFLASVRTILFLGIPLWAAAAGILGYFFVRRTMRPVEEMSEQQRRFMADASHELRTPVAVVRGEAEVSLSKADRSAEELRESLAVIEQESRLLSSIIEDLFLLARADAGHAVLAPTRFYLDELIAEAVHSMRSIAAKKAIVIETSLAAESDIEADERLVRRLVVNLLDNAVKYSPANGHVRVALSRDGDAYGIEVADSAPAIASGNRVRIFKRFYRGDAAGEGAGLGLPIAQSIAQLHGGAIELHSGDEGNVFRVRLRAR